MVSEPYKLETAIEPCLNAADWLRRNLPPRDYLLGALITTTTRALFAADTGLGKTMFGIALAIGLATGSDFLHWKVKRPARILYVDGEMPRELIKERLADAAARIDCGPDEIRNLDILSTEDDWPSRALNTPEGQAWLDAFLERREKYDLIIFDNIASLTNGDMRDEESWRDIERWILSLSARRIGQIWFHHTGHEGGRAYGSKVREWKMDTVMLGERIEEQGAEVAMRITFKKARTRTPSTRADFEPFDLRLVGDEWLTATPTATRQPPKDATIALETLREAIDASGDLIPPSTAAPEGVKGVKLDAWRRYYIRRSPLDTEPDDDEPARRRATESRKKRFQRARDHLQEAGIIQAAGDWYWIIK